MVMLVTQTFNLVKDLKDNKKNYINNMQKEDINMVMLVTQTLNLVIDLKEEDHV